MFNKVWQPRVHVYSRKMAKFLVRQAKCTSLHYHVSFCAVKNKYLFSSDVKNVPRLTVAEKLVLSTPLQMQPYLRLMRIDRPIGKHKQSQSTLFSLFYFE